MDAEFDKESEKYKASTLTLFAYKYGYITISAILYPTVIGVLCWLMREESILRIGVVSLLAILLIWVVVSEVRELFTIKIKIENRAELDLSLIHI